MDTHTHTHTHTHTIAKTQDEPRSKKSGRAYCTASNRQHARFSGIVICYGFVGAAPAHTNPTPHQSTIRSAGSGLPGTACAVRNPSAKPAAPHA